MRPHVRNAKAVSNRELRRQAIASIDLGGRATMILLAVLAQQGGEVTVTDQTIAHVGRRLDDMDYVIVDGVKPGESIVRVVEGKNDTPSKLETAQHPVLVDAVLAEAREEIMDVVR